MSLCTGLSVCVCVLWERECPPFNPTMIERAFSKPACLTQSITLLNTLSYGVLPYSSLSFVFSSRISFSLFCLLFLCSLVWSQREPLGCQYSLRDWHVGWRRATMGSQGTTDKKRKKRRRWGGGDKKPREIDRSIDTQIASFLPVVVVLLGKKEILPPQEEKSFLPSFTLSLCVSISLYPGIEIEICMQVYR